jgi:hypothetical protein
MKTHVNAMQDLQTSGEALCRLRQVRASTRSAASSVALTDLGYRRHTLPE